MTFSVSNLACSRGGITILEGVAFNVAPGEALILRGPNGAGKTTLLRTLAGLTPPSNGSVSQASDDVAYAGHADGLKAQLTVAENLKFWAQIYGSTALNQAVAAFDLTHLMDRQTGYLSAGQKRRLSLSRLILTGRSVWALDEPTVSLDVENVARFAAAVSGHLDGGGAAIIATHIDLGLPNARILDIGQFRAKAHSVDDPFLDGGFV